MDTSNHKTICIPKLQDLCFESFFKKVVCHATSEQVQFIRDLIDQQLVGKVKNNFRAKSVMSLNYTFDRKFGFLAPFDRSLLEHRMILENYHNYSEKKFIVDEFASLECVLDENFRNLKVESLLPTTNSFSKLMAIIAKGSPKLAKLNIKCHPVHYKRAGISSPGRTILDSRFDYLTSLYVHYDTGLLNSLENEDLSSLVDRANQSILSIIGKYCPVLIKLNVFLGFSLTPKHLLGLILDEELSNILFLTDNERWSQGSVLAGLQIPSELLNPLCLSLQELNVSNCTSGLRPRLSCDRPSASAYALALRRLPKLRKLNLDISLLDIWKILYEAKEMDHHEQQTVFERDCKDAAIQTGLEENLISPRTPFTGFQFFEQLNFSIPANDLASIRAISSLFPQLKKISFSNTSTSSDANDCPTEELASILGGLSKVNHVNLYRVNTKFLKVVADVFGANLTCLELIDVVPVDMSLLAPCYKLEHLSIINSIINSEDVNAASRWTPDTFLPMLNSFKTDACLGVWAPLIERKSKLVNLELTCCHIGTNAYNPRLDWSQLPELWPNIVSLSIWRCTGLTITKVSEIIPQLPKLQRILLPNDVLYEDRNLTKKMVEEFATKEGPVHIYYYDDPSYLGNMNAMSFPVYVIIGKTMSYMGQQIGHVNLLM